ncbi:hypothetical protein [Rhodococcus sp. IEGM 1330]|uniref:hypothetical protein n=1 Tax=Rhodococcus sp. IEGM 1330 TaxID=3082225 RepID=UPI0029541C9A|nr:hypothetical protein [Rhodococcus sp. IEGM 1330]MDV8022219.1 hypothetical protein [Rhodococcus sp. IEGM 1330]
MTMTTHTAGLGLYTGGELDEARITLSQFVFDQAKTTALDVGFGYQPASDAPTTYDGLREAYATSQQTGQALPISNQHSDDVIFTSPEANIAHRFVHDVHHCRLGLDFGLIDELELAIWHLDQLEDAGYERGTLEWTLFHADLVGQIQINAFAKRFPDDQRQFGIDCAVLGFERGVLAELRRAR